jgi:gamma-glutamyltranspeptidase/glutathione hydrolase
LRLLENFDLKAMGHLSADYIHVVAEAIKLAMADRDEYYGDPNFVDVPLQKLLSDEYTQLRYRLIDKLKSSKEIRPGDPLAMLALKENGKYRPGIGGTTTCVVADRWGNVVSATPSANVENFDGGRTGVTYSNRLCSLNTEPGHPNCIQPGKRPRITLTPTLVLKNNKPVMAISVAGADLQDQTTLNLLLDFIEFGMLPEAAVTSPRFATKHHQDSFNPTKQRSQAFLKAGSLAINQQINEYVQKELALRGHELEVISKPIAVPVMLYIDPQNGMFYAAGDPGGGRHAAAVSEK